MAALHFTPRQLDAFIAAAELSNFTLAARRLHLTPSGVSSLIGELEAAIGFALFDRTTRRVVLTLAGRRFLSSALAVQRQIDRAAQSALDIRDLASDVVRIAAPLTVAAMLLPPLIRTFQRAWPNTSVRIVDTGVEWLIDRVAIGDADLAIGPDRAVPKGMERHDLDESAWVLWLYPDHPFAARAEVRWADLDAAELIAAGRDHEHSVRPMLLARGLAEPPMPTQIVDNISTALGVVAGGLGLSFSPDYVLPFARAFGLTMRPLVAPAITRHLSLYMPTDRSLGRAGAELKVFLEREVPRLIGALRAQNPR